MWFLPLVDLSRDGISALDEPADLTNDHSLIEEALKIVGINSNFSPKSAINLMHAKRVFTEQPKGPDGILRWAYDVIERETEAAQSGHLNTHCKILTVATRCIRRICKRGGCQEI
jgi:hypothetical protein